MQRLFHLLVGVSIQAGRCALGQESGAFGSTHYFEIIANTKNNKPLTPDRERSDQPYG